MSYIKSEKVKVFPSSLRSGAYSHGKFTTEYNLTRFLKSVTDRDSFVIADPYATPATIENPHYNANYHMFVINGFYFEVDKNALEAMWASEKLYALIKLDIDGRLIAYSDSGTDLDKDSNFIALNFATEVPTGEDVYSVDLKSNKRFAKFVTDTFYLNDSDESLTDVLNDKQPLIKKGDSNRQLDLSEDADLVKGILPVAKGGTGSNALVTDTEAGKVGITVQNSKHLVNDSNTPVNVGDKNTATYFAGGVPYKIDTVKAAANLSSITTNTPVDAGTATKPVYFENGVPKVINSNIDAYALGLQEGKGGKSTDDPTNMTYTSVFFGTDGKVEEGITIHISDKTPTGAGHVGDLWFKYD